MSTIHTFLHSASTPASSHTNLLPYPLLPFHMPPLAYLPQHPPLQLL
jgi:hypothetical protein